MFSYYLSGLGENIWTKHFREYKINALMSDLLCQLVVVQPTLVLCKTIISSLAILGQCPDCFVVKSEFHCNTLHNLKTKQF